MFFYGLSLQMALTYLLHTQNDIDAHKKERKEREENHDVMLKQKGKAITREGSGIRPDKQIRRKAFPRPHRTRAGPAGPPFFFYLHFYELARDHTEKLIREHRPLFIDRSPSPSYLLQVPIPYAT
jgi:hypothetical protein